ncbi:hypothetical protein ACIQ9P_06210 [Kitasatospora sp. NPDC094019]|uniref:hypothetical protein n=1 Tax=Kitasatospora sp. NPDC094019 TaxID=3364091 RepID=UPI0038227EB6
MLRTGENGHRHPGRCRPVWITDVLPHEMVDQVRPRVVRGAEVIEETLEQRAER